MPALPCHSLDACMEICRWAGNPDLFITFTANPKCLEIQSFLDEIPGQNPQDRPDIETRVFKIKLDQLMKDIVQGQQFGRVIAGMMKIKLLSNKNPSKKFVTINILIY